MICPHCKKVIGNRKAAREAWLITHSSLWKGLRLDNSKGVRQIAMMMQLEGLYSEKSVLTDVCSFVRTSIKKLRIGKKTLLKGSYTYRQVINNQ